MTAGGFLSGLRLRRRSKPPVNVDGILQVGSETFRRACAIHEDGTYHLMREHRKVVWEDHRELSRRWHLPEVKRSKLVTALEIERLHDPHTAEADDTAEISPGAKKFLATLSEAAAAGASDIKLFVRNDRTDLRLRLGDAEYTHGDPWTVADGKEAITWLFDVRSKGDGASSEQENEHQSFSVTEGDGVAMPPGVAGLRGDRGPIGNGGDSLVARILYNRDGNEASKLEDLGFDADVLEVLAEERRSKYGLMIIGGSTGDGKSTTLVRQIEQLYRDRGGHISIYTVEDPIEYPIHGAGIAQSSVPVAATGTAREQAYAEMLRHFVRRNPDVGMVSEIRSDNDANVILKFVTSGHKVLSTVHTFSADNVLFRLISLGVSPHELAQPGVVSLIMRQELVAILCPDCAVRPAAPLAERIRLWTGMEDARPMLRNRDGCPTCLKGRDNPTAREAWGGITRKRAVAEYIRVDDTYRGFVESQDSRGARKYWLTPVAEGGLGGITVTDRVRALVARGQVDYTQFTNETLPDTAPKEVR